MGQAEESRLQRLEAVLKFHGIFVLTVYVMATVNAHLRLCGDVEGDPFCHLQTVLLFACPDLAVCIMGRRGRITLHDECAWHAFLTRIGGSLFACHVLLDPGSSVMDLAFGGIVVQTIADFTVVLLMIYSSIELGVNIAGSRSMPIIQGMPFLCSVYRSFQEGEQLSVLPFILGTSWLCMGVTIRAGEGIKANFSRMRWHLRDEVERTMAALRRLEESKAELESVGHGMSRMLKALCDTVVFLDSELCIQNPSGQLCELLQPHGGSGLAGRPLLDFVDKPEDRALVLGNLGVGSQPGAEQKEQSPERAQGGAAGSFNISVRDATGECTNVQVFYARLRITGVSSVLVGLRIEQADRAPPPASEGDSDSLAASLRGDTVDLAEVEPERPATPPRHLEAPSAPAGSEIEPNPSRLAVHLDASSERFAIVGHNPFLGPPGDLRLKPHDLMDWVAEDTQEALEAWIVRSIQSAPWDASSVSEPFPAPLSLALPRVKARRLHVTKAWLDVNPPDEEGELEATLWLEGITVEKQHRRSSFRRRLLATVQELPTEATSSESDHQDSDGSSTLSSSSASSW